MLLMSDLFYGTVQYVYINENVPLTTVYSGNNFFYTDKELVASNSQLVAIPCSDVKLEIIVENIPKFSTLFIHLCALLINTRIACSHTNPYSYKGKSKNAHKSNQTSNCIKQQCVLPSASSIAQHHYSEKYCTVVLLICVNSLSICFGCTPLSFQSAVVRLND